MKRIALALAVTALCGCNASLGLQVGSTGRSATAPTVGPGGSFASSGVVKEQDCSLPVLNSAAHLRCR
jgi:hypothetical protein